MDVDGVLALINLTKPIVRGESSRSEERRVGKECVP